MAIVGADAVSARAYVWDGLLLFVPRALRVSPHGRFAATLLLGLEGPLRLAWADGAALEAQAALVAPNVRHTSDSGSGPAIVVVVDPDGDAYRYVHPLLNGQSVRALPHGLAAGLRQRLADLSAGLLDCAGARRLTMDWLASLCPDPLRALPWDPRLLRACRYMRSCLPQVTPSITQIAAAARLSESRFMHLFREQLGLPVRQYLLWLRIRCAMRLWGEERGVADVAIGSGFYDQAHFTRTMRRMTGYAPSVLRPPDVRVHWGEGPGDSAQ